MNSILNITLKDLVQITRDRKSFMFLLIMPIAFTFMFGYIFRTTDDAGGDSRLKVGLVNQDENSILSQKLVGLLDSSSVIQVTVVKDEASLKEQLEAEKIIAGVLIPAGYGDSFSDENPLKLVVWADSASTDGLSAETEINTLIGRLASAAQTAKILAGHGTSSYDQILESALADWQNPPVKITAVESQKSATGSESLTVNTSSFAHSSPGMILQFAVAGLTTCANVIVMERRNRCLQRLLTTSASRTQILCGHFISIFLTLMAQMLLLILFGDLVLKLTYLSHPLATLLIAATSSLCVAALGLLIGVLAKVEEQAVAFSMVCMFLFSGLGGLWVPLETTGATFQTIGHFTPLSWAMDGFKNVLVRGLDIQSAWLPAAVLCGYTVVFLSLTFLRFRTE